VEAEVVKHEEQLQIKEENQKGLKNQENPEKLKEEDINIFRKYQFLFYKCKFYKDII
jgi:hypothetical protein